MTDPAAVSALARHIPFPPGDTLEDDAADLLVSISMHGTPAQRAAIAAAVLTPEVLWDAMYDANSSHGGYECCAPPTHGSAADILAALRDAGKEPNHA